MEIVRLVLIERGNLIGDVWVGSEERRKLEMTNITIILFFPLYEKSEYWIFPDGLPSVIRFSEDLT
jgi:hypothetical protein